MPAKQRKFIVCAFSNEDADNRFFERFEVSAEHVEIDGETGGVQFFNEAAGDEEELVAYFPKVGYIISAKSAAVRRVEE